MNAFDQVDQLDTLAYAIIKAYDKDFPGSPFYLRRYCVTLILDYILNSNQSYA